MSGAFSAKEHFVQSASSFFFRFRRLFSSYLWITFIFSPSSGPLPDAIRRDHRAGTTSPYGLFRPVTTNGRKVRAENQETARQKAGYVYFSDMLPPPIEAGASCSTAPTD